MRYFDFEYKWFTKITFDHIKYLKKLIKICWIFALNRLKKLIQFNLKIINNLLFVFNISLSNVDGFIKF